MSEEYKIQLGVELDTSDIQDQIRDAGRNAKPIEIKVDAETKELTNTIKDALKSLTSGTKNALTLDTTKIEGSLKDVATTIKDIKTSLDTLDSGAGMKSLLSSVNQISTALGKVENESDNLVKSLSALSKKDFSINFDFKMGKSASQISSEQGDIKRDAISQLKQQAKALEDYLDQYYKVAQKKEGVVKLTQGTNLFSSFWEMSPNIGNTKVSLKQQVATYKQYIDLMQEAAKIKGVDLSSVTSGFSKTTNDIVEETKKVSDGAEEVKQALKGIFGGSLDIEGLAGQLQPIITDLNEIKTAIQSLSSNNSIDGLTQSFNKLSETLEKLISNLTLAKSTLDTGFTNVSSAGSAINVAQQTGQKIGETISKSAKQSINLDDVIDEQVSALMNEYAIAGKKGSKAFDEIRQCLVDFRSGSGDINKVTSAISNNMKVVNDAKNDYKELTEYIKMFNASGAKVHIPDSIKQEYGDDYKTMRSQLGKGFTSGQGMDFETFVIELNSILGQTIDLSYGAEAAFGDLVRKVNSTKGGKFLTGDDLFRSGILDMGDVIANVSTSLEKIENAEEEIARTSTASANVVVQNEEKKQQAIKQTADAIQKTVNETKKLDNVSIDISDGDVNDLKNALKNLKVDDSSIENATKELNELNIVAKSVSGTLRDGNLIKWDIKGVQTTADGLERVVTITKTLGEEGWANAYKYSQSFDKIAAAAKNIQTKLNDTGFYGFEAEMQRAHAEADKLKNSSTELQTALKQLDIAMESINSADQANDIKMLVAANEEYENALKQVYSQLKLNQQEEKKEYSVDKLKQQTKALSLDMSNWLKDNSAAANRFGNTIQELQIRLKSCDDVELGNIKREFQLVQKEARELGLTTQTLGDKIKTKFKEYSAYFSVAEVFMYAEQALRDMFEQVLAIDTAMTELKKVTNETDAAYNQFLSNAASRAKEIGTTIDGLVTSTADFARLGYGFKESQGLAEVANIYAVVGDDIDSVETATQSLISTLTAFKDEANGLSNDDFALSIVDKMNEVSNNFAISSGGLGEALQRSASSMMAANNSLDETIALITAAM